MEILCKFEGSMQEAYRELPIKLIVNRESRLETRRHYLILFRSDVPGIECLNPRRDSVFLTDNDISHDYNSSQLGCRILAHRIPTSFLGCEDLKFVTSVDLHA